MKIENRKHRVVIVNEIIKEISSRGRMFFSNEGKIAEIVDKGKIYYKAEYGEKELLCLSVRYNKPKGWFHGGTLLRLVQEFKEFIKTGDNPNNYSGLYSPHWAYPELDMEAIRNKATELGYLKFE